MAILEAAIFVAALIVLVKGSDYFVKAAASIAEKFGVSEFVIGLTLVALGTSVPELASSIVAAFKGESEIIIGNVVGSNIANIGLVIGLAASACAIKTEDRMLTRDGYIMLFVSIVFYIFMINGTINRYMSFILLVFYLAYVVFIFETKEKGRDEYHFRAFIPYFYKMKYILAIHRRVVHQIREARNKESARLKAFFEQNMHKDILVLIVSCAAVYFGARFLVDEAVFFANLFQVPKDIIGVTLIAFGTSVPELSVSVTAAKKGYGNIAVGNILGSNIANILLVIGVTGMISPIIISKITLLFTAPFMLIMSLMLLFFIKGDWKIHRLEGVAFLAMYGLFIAILSITLARLPA